MPGLTFPVQEKYFADVALEMHEAYPAEFKRMLQVESDTVDYMRIENSFKGALGPNAVNADEHTEATIDWKRERSVTVDGQVVNDREDAIVPLALVVASIAHVTRTSSEGAVLVFLPGYNEIKKVSELLRMTAPFGVDFEDRAHLKLLTFHSSVPASEQQEALDPAPGGLPQSHSINERR